MSIKLGKSDKPAQVPRLGWTIFIGVIGVEGFIAIFDPTMSKTNADRFGSAVAGIGFSVWAILRVQQMQKFRIKLRKKPHLAMTIFILMLALTALSEVFGSTITTSNNQTVADKMLWAFLGCGFLLWAVLRYIFAKEFEKKE